MIEQKSIKNMPIGISDFAKLVSAANNYLFADKTKFIADIIDHKSQVILLTRPRRFGKTLNMSMLHYFLSNRLEHTKDLFTGLEIAKINNGAYLEQQGKFPIIFITFKDIKKNNFAEAYENIVKLISSTYDSYNFLLNSEKISAREKEIFGKIIKGDMTRADVSDSLRFLSSLLSKHYDKSVWILMDEYDTPLNAAYIKDYLDPMTDLIRGLMGAAFKDNPYLEKGVITGIFRVAKENIFSGLNNLDEYSLLDPEYADSFGFTEQEVIELLAEKDMKNKMVEVREWYNGYQFGEKTIYNPWSIIKYLKTGGKAEAYWIGTSSNDMIFDLLANVNLEVKAQVEKLISGQIVEVMVGKYISFRDLGTQDAALWTLFVFGGYLTVREIKSVVGSFYRCVVKIPNTEVLGVYQDIFSNWMTARIATSDYFEMLRALSCGDVTGFLKKVKEYLLKIASYQDFAKDPEAFYHGLILGLTAGMLETHLVKSNRETGLGRADLIFIPKDQRNDLAIILEFKQTKKSREKAKLCQEAMAQIEVRHYETEITQHTWIKRILKIGLVFCKKDAVCESKLDVV